MGYTPAALSIFDALSTQFPMLKKGVLMKQKDLPRKKKHRELKGILY